MGIMSKAKVLFFAADPLSAPPDGRMPRLLLDEDVRQIREKVRAAEHRDALEFDVRWAARTDDLLQALNETRPQVVHFSGHGGSEGLVLAGSDGRGPHCVDAAALARLFQVFKGDIRVVVLNACFSLPQAEAIAGAVGCAIGTRSEISDTAAIIFGASFYRALAFGQSVQTAYDQARTALALEQFEDRECPQLVVRPGVDPARLVLIPQGGVDTSQGGRGRVGTTIGGLALAGALVVASVTLADRTRRSEPLQPADSAAVDASRTRADSLPTKDSTMRVPARNPAVSESGGGGRQPVVATHSVDAGKQSVDTPRSPVNAPTYRKLSGPRDTFAVLTDRPRDPTIPPVYPR
jgi:hypothetical protein